MSKSNNELYWFGSPEISLYLFFLVLLVVVVVVFLCRHSKIVVAGFRTLARDVRGIYRLIKIAKVLRCHQKNCHSVGDVFDKVAEKWPFKICLKFEDQQWTFKEVWERSNQVGNYFLNQGFKKGDVIALFMENRPEYVCVWLGLSKIGVVSSLINTQLRNQPLRHSFQIVDTKAIIYGDELSEAVLEVFKNDLSEDKNILHLFCVSSFRGCNNSLKTVPGLQTHSKLMDTDILACSITNPMVIEAPKFADSLFYMYTSGTTGLPKAAIVKHARYIVGALGVHHFMNIRTGDVVYTCLPLYHTSAGIVGVGQALLGGCTVVVCKRFSATQFWKDCVLHRVTVAQYIGEICRYLLSQEVTVMEKQHCVRLMVGNGLRPEIWKVFVDRFNIPNVSETYGSTDGNCNMMNFDGRVGAVGFLPIWAYKMAPTCLIKVDPISGEPFRDSKTGLAIKCKPNEWGELVGKIVENNPIREFKGYAGKDTSANEKKIVRDVCSKGDEAFRTGDYLVMDDCGYFYFKDRSGDTFRWKGENVSAAEVESIISSICSLKDCVVYGVWIPGTDGRAGMATIATDDDYSLNLHTLAQGVTNSLPPYARPLFLRVSRNIELTGTHKMKKYELQLQGFDIRQIEDPVYYFLDEKYVPLDPDLYASIIQSKIRV